ncbi:MAG: preprotein translocase subunit SecA [Planctomycetes bacterium]|nr:preprotein translocase subunit SecA [Planctomycetota bacterium]
MLEIVGRIFLKMIGGSRNERICRGHMRFVTEKINPLEGDIRGLSEEQLLQRSAALKERLKAGQHRDSVKAEAFALVREASRRAQNHRQFDVQLVAGMILDRGWIAEESTGEGKTIACYPAILMTALEGRKTHVVTVNDYLVKRDADFAKPIFSLLGVTVGYITADMDNKQRKEMYACDITYGTNSEFGFDYLRDNMKMSVADQVQGRLDFAIVDEVDSILIDEARTPLIISGPAAGQTDLFRKADAVIRQVIENHKPWDRINRRVEALKRQIKALTGESDKAKGDAAKDVQAKLDEAGNLLIKEEDALAGETKYYEVELDKKSAHLTHEGIAAAQDIAGVGSFYVGANMAWPHLMEQALRAHLVFEKDKDYVAQQGQIVIVDEFTGRLLEGREWSDGLHQAVCAKEHVPIKEENQTLATITIQNYFKLYKKLAGMTGTAMTEASEFMKIYKLDVVSVPTHRPVNRVDHNDRIYGEVSDKFDAIVEEINTVSKAGRPVLVGTTSIEKSEVLSAALTRRYGIEHQVLNARPENAAREADIVVLAGQQRPLKKGAKEMVGTVTIATNMAGRGTDIKLGPGVVDEKCKVPPPEKLAELGLDPEDLFPTGTNKCCMRCPQYDGDTNCSHCFKPKLHPEFPVRGRFECPQDVPCGLHVVGTERHEARRIDNQLRGRSGRQGDPASSRFFLSLRDDLMAIFAGEWTLKVLGWLGLQGDVAIEDRRVSKGIENAQKKVEERNFDIRKNLLEYDEVMDYQRRAFYADRQKILEGRQIEGLTARIIRDAVDEGVDRFLAGRHVQQCIAEWAKQNLQIPIEPEQIKAQFPEDMSGLIDDLRVRAKEEASSVIAMTLGEYMDEDADPADWDLKGLVSWAMSRFGVNLSQSQLRKMQIDEVERLLGEAASQKIDQIDMSEAGKYLDKGFAEAALAEWAGQKFALEFKAQEMFDEAQEVKKRILDKVMAAYDRRRIEYPVEYAMDWTIGQGGVENIYALTSLAAWANQKYQAGIAVEELQNSQPKEIYRRLVGLSEAWQTGGKLEQCVSEALGTAPTAEKAVEFAKSRFDTDVRPEDLNGRADVNIADRIVEIGRRFLRREMTELERFVLLHIYDSAWKDHLLAMDHLKGGIGLRGYAERDPKVAYKIEGSRMFEEMLQTVRDRVTDMIFRVRLAANTQMQSVYQISNMVHDQLSAYDQAAQDMSQQEAAMPHKVQQIVRDAPRVGRNDPCPCGSGKKYKQCCGKDH